MATQIKQQSKTGFLQFKEMVEGDMCKGGMWSKAVLRDYKLVKEDEMSVYFSDKWTNDLMERVGMNDMAVEMNERFAMDMLNECLDEYNKTGDQNVFMALNNIEACFSKMFQKSLSNFQRYLSEATQKIVAKGAVQ